MTATTQVFFEKVMTLISYKDFFTLISSKDFFILMLMIDSGRQLRTGLL